MPDPLLDNMALSAPRNDPRRVATAVHAQGPATFATRWR